MSADDYKIDNFQHQPHVIPAATETSAGVMSAADKTKLDGIAPGGDTIFLIANGFPGADLGAKVQAANDFLGNVAGTIYIKWGADAANNTFTTNVKLNANKTIYFGPGFFSTNLPDIDNLTGVLFLARGDNVTIMGSGWDTIIQQPRRMFMIGTFSNLVVDGGAAGINNFNIANFQIVRPANPRASTGGESAFASGNSNNVLISNVFFNGTWGIGWTLGGNAVAPIINHCSNAVVTGCVMFFGHEDDGIQGACVNARDWVVTGCEFLNGAAFDVEQNTANDDQGTFVISGCLWHGGGSLLIQGPQARDGTISGCTFEGDRLGTTAIGLNSCINTKVVGCFIDGYNGNDLTSTVAVNISTCNNVSIENCTITNCSLVSFSPNPAGAPPLRIQNSVGTIVSGNIIASPQHGWSAVHEDAASSGTVLEGNYFGLGSGSTITLVTGADNPRFGRISAASNGQALPQASIFSPLCAQLQNAPGTMTIVTSAGLQTVSYTGVSAVAFTGCSGGVGVMSVGSEPDITLSSPTSRAWNNTVETGDGTTSIIWSRDPVVQTSTFANHRTVSGAAQVATVADAIIGVDTSSAACDITLPDPAVAFVSLASPVVSASWQLLIQDEANNAAAKNITIKRASGGTKINGVAADKVISTNSGALSFYTNGTDWFAR